MKASLTLRKFFANRIALEIAQLADKHKPFLSADPGAEYDRLVEIDLDKLQPHVNGPFTPDLASPIDKLAENARKNNWPLEVKVGQ